MTTTSPREAILARISAALGTTTSLATATAGEGNIPRAYQRSSSLAFEQRIALFEERLRDYDAEVFRATNAQVRVTVQNVLLAQTQATPTLVPSGFPPAWLPNGVTFTEDEGLSASDLDRFDTVLTAATLAIAETGTLVLVSGPSQGRRATTLVPDTHVCVVRAQDIVESVPEAFTRLAPHSHAPITFVSGPSATADIEMTRIKGVHGPRFLHVIIVDDAPPSSSPP